MEKETVNLSIHNGPGWLSHFVGREQEKAEVARLLGQTRLLTLTGPGGCGKTRLGLETARVMCPAYADGVWLIELADLAEPERIAQSAAQVFGLVEGSARSSMQRLVDHLREKSLLLVLDNCEHLIEACARFAHALLAGCPGLTILATSREPLHIAGELTWVVPSLTLPDWHPGFPIDGLMKSEAVMLFLERARAVRADFHVKDESAEAILSICRQVDGIPLAIELAAARIGAFSAAEIARQMSATLGWLENSDRLAPQRQHTLASTVAWSHDLLSAEEQRLFRRLAVFTGGFDLQAAEAVGAEEGGQPPQTAAGLARLVDKSFVVRGEINGDESRYRMLEIIRQYGRKKLAQAGEEQKIRGRHMRWCLDFADKSQWGILHQDRGRWVNRVEAEQPNLRQAIGWGISEGSELENAHILAFRLCQFWQLRGYFREGLGWMESLVAHSEGIPARVMVNTLDMASFFAQHLWNFELGKTYMEKALELWREIGDLDGEAWGLSALGWMHEQEGDYAQAQQCADESMALFKKGNGQRPNRYGVHLLACDLAYFRGDYNSAEQHLKKSMEICRLVGDEMAYARRETRLAQIAIEKGSLKRARTLLKHSLEANRSSGDRWNMAMILVAAVHLNVAQGKMTRAARCLGAVQVFLEWFETYLWPLDRMIFERNLRLVQNALNEVDFLSAQSEGRKQGVDVEQATVFAAAMLEEPTAQAKERPFDGLTPREREIAVLISQGKNNTEIAEALFLGVRTIEAHVTHILNKLDFSSRTQIAVWAVQKGLR